MKILHIADLHFGKSVHGVQFADSEDQADWIGKFLLLAKDVRPDAILIAGDVYDRSNPPREAIRLAGHMLSELMHMDKKPVVMMAAGNHDSGSMIEYLGDVIESDGIFVSGVIERDMRRVTLTDEYGEVDFYIAPYAFPAEINRVLGTDFRDYDSAFTAWLEAQDIDRAKRSVIVSHQNITFSGREAECGGSETMVGGVGGIDAGVFDGFEYAALGHIHAAQPVGRDNIRYAGSPLCYHFDELRHPKKGPVLIELGPKGIPPKITICPIEPLHPMRDVSGTFPDIVAAEQSVIKRGEYIRVTLLPDGNGIFMPEDADEQLRALFAERGSLVLDMRYAAPQRAFAGADIEAGKTSAKSLQERFLDFWAERRGGAPDAVTMELLELIAAQETNSAGGDAVTAEDSEKVIDFLMTREADIR